MDVADEIGAVRLVLVENVDIHSDMVHSSFIDKSRLRANTGRGAGSTQGCIADWGLPWTWAN